MLRKLRAFVASAVVFAAVPVHGQILFSTENGPNITLRGAASGPSQRISVTNDSELQQFGFWIGTTGAVDLKFMIWNADGTMKLFEQVKTVTDSPRGSLVLTDAFNFTLLGGQTYDFAVIGNGNIDVGVFSTPTVFSQNGFTNINPNGNYGGYDNPTFFGLAGGTVAVQLRGVQSTVVPEPNTVVLLAAGLASLVVVRRRRLV